MKIFYLLAVVVGLIGVYWLVPKNPKSISPVAEAQIESYWTCPMHPEVHQDHPGECPICHMTLVKVEKVKSQGTLGDVKRSEIEISPVQWELLGAQKFTVDSMDMRLQIPISGRFVSSRNIAFQIYEQDLRYVKPGQKIVGASNTYQDQTLEANISSIDSIVDPSSRTIRVSAQVTKGPSNQMSESSFRGQIEILLTKRIVVPENSVIHSGSGDLVYLFVTDTKVKALPVKLGAKSEGYYEVLDGLSKGQIISSGPNFLLDSEAKIRGTND